MRSRLLVFLLVLMPLQLCWAAVAGYCNAAGAGSSPSVALHCCKHGLLPSDARVAEPMLGQAADQGLLTEYDSLGRRVHGLLGGFVTQHLAEAIGYRILDRGDWAERGHF